MQIHSINHVNKCIKKLQRLAVVSAVAIAASVEPRWTMDRKVNALVGSNQGCLELYDLKRIKLDSNVTNLSLFLCVQFCHFFSNEKHARSGMSSRLGQIGSEFVVNLSTNASCRFSR